MKLALSYFYQIRFFKPYMIPVSTAIWDPKWFHDFQGQDFTFLDKNGVVNGLRCEELHPGEKCTGLCNGKDNCCGDPSTCDFLRVYRWQLNAMDLNAFMQRAQTSAEKLKEQLGFEEEPVIVLIVHESPDNPCSERAPLLQYFADNGIECQELEYPIS